MSKGKIHLRVLGVDCRNQGQTEHEFTHQAACGYVRDNVTTSWPDVNCSYCKRTSGYDEQAHGEADNA